jgi:transcriptional regulator NrdR family protein
MENKLLNCPNCGTPASRKLNKVLETRHDTVESKIRQRKCLNCGNRWWTCETDLPPGAVKWASSENDTSTFTVPRRVPGFLRITYS